MNRLSQRHGLQRLETRQLLAGVVDTSLAYHFGTADVPAIVATLSPGGTHDSELPGFIVLGNSYIDNPAKYTASELDECSHWITLATLYRYKLTTANPNTLDAATGLRPATDYSNELKLELNEFSAAYDTIAERSAWNSVGRHATGKRVQNWITTYYLMYSSGTLNVWDTPTRGTFNNMLGLQGDFLYDRTTPALSNVPNQRIQGITALYMLGKTSTLSNDWDGTGTSTATNWLNKGTTDYQNEVLNLNSLPTNHFRQDGGHFEQSPNYASASLEAMMKVAFLEAVSGGTPTVFTAVNKNNLVTITNALYSLVGGDGNFVATGDTDYAKAMGKFTLPAIYLDSLLPGVNYNRPEFGQSMTSWLDASRTASYSKGTDERPSNTRADQFLANSGFSALRLTNSQSAVQYQLSFDAGPFGSFGTLGHGQHDLLNIDLGTAQRGRRLINDPGYDNSPTEEGATYRHSSIVLKNNSNNKYVNHGFGGFGSSPNNWNDSAATSNTYFAANSSMQSTYSIVRAAHRGYDSLNPSTTVYRTIYSNKTSAFLVMDWVTCLNYNNTAEVGFNVGAGASPMQVGSVMGYQSGYSNSYNVWIAPISLGANASTSSRRTSLNKINVDLAVADSTIGNGLRFTDTSTPGVLNLGFLTLIVPWSKNDSDLPAAPSVVVSSVNASTGTVTGTLGGNAFTLDRISGVTLVAPPNAAATVSQSYVAPASPVTKTATIEAGAGSLSTDGKTYTTATGVELKSMNIYTAPFTTPTLAGSKVLLTNSYGEKIRIRRTDGSLFSLNSIDLIGATGNVPGNLITIKGYISGSSAVETYSVPAQSMNRATLSGVLSRFVNLNYVDIEFSTGTAAIDNISLVS
jgi:hypothetical protein